MHQLQVLKIITPRIRTVPQEIRYLHNVYHLELRDCDLEEFPAAVCDMRNLTFLDLSDNRTYIEEIPKGICGKLRRLQRLRMGGCGLICLPDDMVELRVLDLSWNSLCHLCGKLKNMTTLTAVFLNGNPFKSIEREFPFDYLVNIEFLMMDSTNMTCLLGEIGQMVKIKHIFLRNNNLTRLPKDICNISSQASIYLSGNPMREPPLDVCHSGMVSIKSYFQSLEGEHTVKRTLRTKMVIHGESGSGKSSLIRAIEQVLKGATSIDACVNEEDRTVGIEQHQVSLREGVLLILDSGGQRSYSPITQLFISNNCLAIVTADATQYTVTVESFKRLIRPYLQRVYDYVKEAVVQLVITKSDMVTDEKVKMISADLRKRS